MDRSTLPVIRDSMSKVVQLVLFFVIFGSVLGNLVDRFNFCSHFPHLHLCGGMPVDAQSLPRFRLQSPSFYDCSLKYVESK